MNKNDIVLQAAGLTCHFGDFIAVDQLDISIPRGAIYGFIGSNGSGKTTTIRMLCGLLRPTAGEAHILGYDVAADTAKVKQHIGSIMTSPPWKTWISMPTSTVCPASAKRTA